MDPATTPLGKMLLEEITPVVMVLRTPLVEEACLKNGLSFIEMLSPFCTFSNIDGLAPFSHYIYISVRRIYVFVWSNWSFWDEFWVEIELLFFFFPSLMQCLYGRPVTNHTGYRSSSWGYFMNQIFGSPTLR